MHLRENRRGRTGADSAYVLHAGPPGFGFAGGPGPRGAHRLERQPRPLRRARGDRRVRARRRRAAAARRGPARHATRPTRARGSTARSATGSTRSPAASTATCGPGRGRSRPTRPVTLNVWEAVYFDHDRDRLLDLADRAAEVGVERFVLDDGWFGARRDDRAGLGDWVVSADVWPDGLHPLVDRVRELGMQFGLWFEPEMVNPDSDVARAHPEWIMSARPEWPVESRAPAGAQPRHPRGVRARQGPDAGAARRVRHRLHQVGPQPRPRRGGHADRRRSARRARPDAGVLPAARRAPRGPPGAGDRVLLVGRRPGRPGGAGAHRPGVGVGQHRPARPAARCCAGPASSSRRSTSARTSRPAVRT